MASLSLPPSHPEFPHPALLHAICATASRWTSRDVSVSADGARRDRFAEFHASKTRTYIDQTMASGAQIFAVLQACIILSWYLYAEGRWVEVWIFAGFQTRVAVPLRLNYPGTHSKPTGAAPAGYLPAPSTVKELELRRRTWWMSLVFDRIVSVGGWLHGIDERDIGTELPLRSVDFETDVRARLLSTHCLSFRIVTLFSNRLRATRKTCLLSRPSLFTRLSTRIHFYFSSKLVCSSGRSLTIQFAQTFVHPCCPKGRMRG